jgi:hypothetical protein
VTFDPKVPPSLLALQKWMGEILIRPLRAADADHFPLYDPETDREIEARISAGPLLSPSQRVGIYNQQFWFRLFVILQQDFPTLTALFGYGDFNRLIAEPYLLKYFPSHWSLNCLGRHLPSWLNENYQDEDKGLVYQTALLDEAYADLFFAGRYPALEQADLSKAFEKTLFLQPYIAVFELDGDLLAFRTALLKESPKYWVENDFPKIDWSKRQFILLYPQQGEVVSEEISDWEAGFLQIFKKGATLTDACALMEGRVEDISQLVTGFKKWAERGWLSFL